MDDLLREFLTETNESIGTLDVELVHLEQNPNNPGLIDSIFRLVHTIKGTCGFLGLPRLAAVAHASENVLGKFRDGKLEVTPSAVTLILESLDRIKELLAILERTEAEPEGDDADLIARLDAMAEGKTVIAPAAEAPAEPEPVAVVEAEPAPEPEVAAPPALAPAAVKAPAKAAASKAPAKPAASKPAASKAAPAKAAAAGGPADAGLGRALKPGEVSLEELEAVFQSASGPAAQAPAPAAAPASAPAPAPAAKAAAKPAAKAEDGKKTEDAVANQSIRVSVDLLENLMTMVSELVLTRNQLLQMVRALDNSDFTVPLQRLSHVTTELQEGVMKTRMQPIGNAWSKVPRIIRDLSMELGKKIDLQMHGAETELDRQVLELIKDPLTHMVRNSADHGLERPEERVKAGKPEVGRLDLNAFHEGGHIVIQIKDDGRGLNTQLIKKKAVETGIATEAELANMTNQQIHQFIMKAGFSTAEKVTNVSGRGVGMDVVRSNIEKIGGTVEMRSEEGKGCTFTIKIPLTLAIVSALIVECAGERFAIPQIGVVELVRVAGGSDHKIERINDATVLRLRNRLLPLISLDRRLGLREGKEDAAAFNEKFIVVAQVGSFNFGIVVDRVFDTEEIVVKPVAPILRDIGIFSGNTILGDGSVIMILDPNGLVGDDSEKAAAANLAAQEDAHEARASDLVPLLLFRAGRTEPKAVPLGLVARLEEIEAKQIEHVNGQHVVQYRGKLMPVIPIDEAVTFRTEGRQPVLVFADGERSMGLAVDAIVDIVEAELRIELASEKKGTMGSAVIGGRATEVVDVAAFLNRAFGDWFGAKEKQRAFGAGKGAKRILLVDDSPFFRNMLTPLLGVAGYEVTSVASAAEALRLREKGRDFDLIISDIEMPEMNGFEFAQEVKRGDRWQATPIVALTSHTAPEDFDRGRESGFDDYIAKFDRDALLGALAQTLAITKGAA